MNRGSLWMWRCGVVDLKSGEVTLGPVGTALGRSTGAGLGFCGTGRALSKSNVPTRPGGLVRRLRLRLIWEPTTMPLPGRQALYVNLMRGADVVGLGRLSPFKTFAAAAALRSVRSLHTRTPPISSSHRTPSLGKHNPNHDHTRNQPRPRARVLLLRNMATNGVNGVASGGPRATKANPDFSAFKVNQSRLMEHIHDGCQFGAAHRYGDDPTETGMARLSLNDADKQVRAWFTKTATAIGCKVTVDEMGNQFAVLSSNSKNPTAPPVMMGSHLDTQPTGGRYDGILGVNAGLEVLRVVADNKYQTHGPIGVVNWTNEEGARFPMMAVSSGVWAGAVPLETAWNLAEVSPSTADGQKRTMKQELERIDNLGQLKCSHLANPFAAHFELHIEQGPILEAEKRRVGVVKGAQAFKWFDVTVRGRDTHAGTTPFYARKDSMLCAARLIVESNRIAKAHGGLATSGILTQEPGSVNTIAHTVRFSLDIRHVEDATLKTIQTECEAAFARMAKEECEAGCEVEWKELVDSPAVRFHPECIAAVEEAAEEAVCGGAEEQAEDGGKLWKHMISGAGHDSCYTNRRCPTSMVFAVTKDGVSHNPREYCAPEDCAIGTQVLLGAVLRFDKRRKF